MRPARSGSARRDDVTTPAPASAPPTLLTDPAGALVRNGMELPAGAAMRMLDVHPGELSIVLPAVADPTASDGAGSTDALADEQSAGVSGGRSLLGPSLDVPQGPFVFWGGLGPAAGPIARGFLTPRT